MSNKINPGRVEQMISSLSLKNYRGFSACDFELRPITLLLGPNNSGKSAAMSALKLLSQTIESYDRSVTLLLNGKYGDFGTYKDLVHKNVVQKPMSIGMSVTSRAKSVEGAGKVVSSTLGFKFNAPQKRIELHSSIFSVDGVEQAAFERDGKGGELKLKSVLGREPTAEIKRRIKDRISFFHFLPNSIWLGGRGGDMDKVSKGQLNALEALQPNLRSIYSSLINLDYLSALRLAPSRTYAYSGEQHKKIGASGENSMSILAMNSLSKSGKGAAMVSAVTAWLKSSGMAKDVRVKDLAGRFFEVQVNHPSSDFHQNIADVGFGISQVMPVLVGGLNCSRGSTFLVEEPEIHLHPRAQAELGDFLLRLKGSGVQVIAETHSEHLVLRLLQYVASGRLKPEDIVFYSVQGVDCGCGVEKIEVDEKGMFLSDWPSGFFPERLNEAKKLALARASSK